MLVLDGGGGGGSAGGDLDVDTWVPGHPDQLDAIAVELERFGQRNTNSASEVAAVVGAVEGSSWDGSARAQYLARLSALPPRLHWIGTAYHEVAGQFVDLAATARELRAKAGTLIDELVANRTAMDVRESARDRALEAYISALFTDETAELWQVYARAERRLADAEEAVGHTMRELQGVAAAWHEACAEAALAVDAAEPEELLDTDFASLVREGIDDGVLRGLIDNWMIPGGLDDPELDAQGDYEYRGNEELWGPDGPLPDDIRQGDLGDCWLLAVLAGAASVDPDSIRRMIQRNPDGTFTVTFADGERVTVDGEVRDSGGHALWVSIIEKAYAQREGGYDEIDGGNANEAFDDLFGSGNDSFDPDSTGDWIFGDNVSPSDTYDRIDAALDDGRIVTASVSGTIGIGGGHALTVTDVRTRGGTKYVVVRNPWGSNESIRAEVEAAGGTINGAYIEFSIDEFADEFYKVRMEK